MLHSTYNQVTEVDPENPNKIIGYLQHEDLIHVYLHVILRRKEPGDEDLDYEKT